MNTLIIYDDKGKVFLQLTGDYLTPQGGVQFLELIIPAGKRIKSVDVTVMPNVAILEDIPKTETQMLQDKIQATQEAIDFLLMGGI